MSVAHTEYLAEIGALASIVSIGDSYDNSLAESVNGLYKAGNARTVPCWRINCALDTPSRNESDP